MTVAARLNAMQEELCSQNEWDFSDLTALFVNCTLKRSPDVSKRSVGRLADPGADQGLRRL